ALAPPPIAAMDQAEHGFGVLVDRYAVERLDGDFAQAVQIAGSKRANMRHQSRSRCQGSNGPLSTAAPQAAVYPASRSSQPARLLSAMQMVCTRPKPSAMQLVRTTGFR